ncbi:MAG: T9SS type A sorting domain-containing protein [Fluviicola sp.]|nr:T9SS type A sorting domain-containing protein [Fluviicola sp.]
MKKLITLIALGTFGMFSNAFGQVTGYYPYPDSIPGCGQNTLVVYVQGGANPETGGILSIDWGDGSTGTENFTIPSTNGWLVLNVDHSYATPGVYTVQTSVYSTTAGADVDAGQTNQMTAVDPTACGYLYTGVYQTTPSYNYFNAPIDFTDVNGIVTTINNSQGAGNSYYQGLNPANAPYTVSVNDQWLATNGLTQVTADATITSFGASGSANISQYYFEVTCAVGAANPDFAVSYVWPSNFVAPLETGTLYAYVCNYACANTSDASVSIDMPAGFIPNTSSLSNATVNGTTLTFDILNLTDCEFLQIPFTFPGTTPAGTQICFDVTVSNPNDTDPSNNNESNCSFVLNSYDPNDKQVNQPTHINPAAQETLNYMIQFQNEGNYAAVNVVVKDTLDADLDLSTFKVLGTKHGVATTLNPTTRVVTFTFSNINLAPSSQDVEASKGYILYSIEENAGLPIDSEIENTAYIYFDFNPAIITNTTLNVNSTLSVNELDNETIAMYPNPAQNSVQFSGATIESVSIFDLSGKEVFVNNSVLSNSISIDHLTNGLYQAIVTTAKGTHNMKLVVKK